MRTRYGGPEVVRFEDVPDPVPGKDELLVRVHATTVNRTDTGFRQGKPWFVRFFSGVRRPKRQILGSEFAGVVETVGAAVTEFAVGDEVFGVNSDRFGAHAEYVCVREKAPIVRKPSTTTFEEAAAVCDGAILAMNIIEEIHKKLPNMHLVMHGSSSVPQDLQDIINQYGGQMKPTWGVPVEEIQRGIKHGVRKINIDTDNRMAMTGQIRKVLKDHPEEFDPRKYLKPAMEAMTKICKQRLEEFNTAGQASKIKKVLTTAEMAKRYTKGELDPRVA